MGGNNRIPTPAVEQTLTSAVIYRGKNITLELQQIKYSNRIKKDEDLSGDDNPSSPSLREIVHFPDTVGIIAIMENNILLVNQYRKAVEQFLLEIPAGKIEAGETPKDAASRELIEETGYLAKTMEPLGSFYLSPGFCTEKMHLFLARDLVIHPIDQLECEPVILKADEFLNKIDAREISDAKTLIAAAEIRQKKSLLF